MNSRYVLVLSALMFASVPVGAVPIGHHGGMILDCKPPQFFDEVPAADSKVSGQVVSVTASDDTDAETVKFWINNQPIKPTVAQEHSGRYRIEAALPAGTSGRVWLKVEAYSHEGCDNFKSWYVSAGN